MHSCMHNYIHVYSYSKSKTITVAGVDPGFSLKVGPSIATYEACRSLWELPPGAMLYIILDANTKITIIQDLE